MVSHPRKTNNNQPAFWLNSSDLSILNNDISTTFPSLSHDSNIWHHYPHATNHAKRKLADVPFFPIFCCLRFFVALDEIHRGALGMIIESMPSNFTDPPKFHSDLYRPIHPRTRCCIAHAFWPSNTDALTPTKPLQVHLSKVIQQYKASHAPKPNIRTHALHFTTAFAIASALNATRAIKKQKKSERSKHIPLHWSHGHWAFSFRSSTLIPLWFDG